MTQRIPMIFALLTLGLLAGVAVSRPAAQTHPSAGPGKALSGAPVVIELFTSQGCSSCPPADRLLSRLGREGLDGTPVIPLSFHVDYWNYIGWQDPFSQSRWSRRQEEYARTLAKGRLYTPQAVIQGREDCVGSRRSCLEQAITRAAETPPGARLEVDLEHQEGGEVLLTLAIGALGDGALQGSGEVEALAVVFEKGLETPVSRGENARKTLKNDYVVRHLESVLRMSIPEGEAANEGQTVLPLDPEWRRENLGVAVLLQEVATRHILAAWTGGLPG